MQARTLKLLKLKLRREIQKFLLKNTDAGENVFVSRSTKFDDSELPAILIYPSSEKVRLFEDGPKSYERTFLCKIEVIGRAATDDELDEKLERIAEQVEVLMELNNTNEKTIGPLINDLNLTGSLYVFEGDGATPIGSLVLEYEIEFVEPAPGIDVELEAFLGLDVKWKLPTDAPGDDGLVKATDKIDLPQT